MNDRKFTDEEVIKAFECCIGNEKLCSECPYEELIGCGRQRDRNILDLINRQKAEIERLINAVDNSTMEFLKIHDEYKDQKAEIERLQKYNTDVAFKHYNDGIKEFAEKAKRRLPIVSPSVFDQIVKELTEEKE